jgi:hypothetical protein
VTVRVPAAVETRVRRKWSRRAKLIGAGGIVLYLSCMIVPFVLFDRPWIFMQAFAMFNIGLAGGVRYLKAARLIELGKDQPVPDEHTRRLVDQYEERIRVEGRREVAGGSLSMPRTATEGELSLPRGGDLSVSDENGR